MHSFALARQAPLALGPGFLGRAGAIGGLGCAFFVGVSARAVLMVFSALGLRIFWYGQGADDHEGKESDARA